MMHLTISGHHLEITPALQAYVENKLERISRHFDHIVTLQTTLSMPQPNQFKAEVHVQVRAKIIHAESVEPDMYTAIDLVADKIDRQLLKYKERREEDRRSQERRARTIAAMAGDRRLTEADTGRRNKERREFNNIALGPQH